MNLQLELENGLSELFAVAPKGDLTRVRTPFLYPDGGVIDIFASAKNGSVTLTDLGESLGWLRTQSLSARRSPKQQRLVQDVCQTQGVELFKGQLMLRCDDPAQLAAAVVRLGQAAVRVADLWFMTRTRSVESTTDEVADFLIQRVIAHDRAVRLAGRSGREWTIDFQTRTPERSSLVCVLASGSRAAARRVSEHVVAAWHDLSNLTLGPQALHFVSLVDDPCDVWEEEDFKLVESVSDVCRWSESDQFERVLRPVA